MKKALAAASWICLVLAGLTALVALAAHWAVNAESLGARDLGVAISAVFLNTVATIGAMWAAPVLVVAGAIALRADRGSGLRLVAAGAVCAIPLSFYAWLG